MVATLTEPDAPEVGDLREDTLSGARKLKNRMATGFMVVAFLVAAVPLLFVVATVISHGVGVIPDRDASCRPRGSR